MHRVRTRLQRWRETEVAKLKLNNLQLAVWLIGETIRLMSVKVMLFHHGNTTVRPVGQQQCAKASVLSSTYNPFPITHCLCPVCHALTHVCSGWLFFNLNVSCSFFNSLFTSFMSSIHLTQWLTTSHTFFAHTCRDHLSARVGVLANECF